MNELLRNSDNALYRVDSPDVSDFDSSSVCVCFHPDTPPGSECNFSLFPPLDPSEEEAKAWT